MESLAPPEWLWALLAAEPSQEGDTLTIRDQEFVLVDGILRERAAHSSAQSQTKDAFGFKWAQRETFESERSVGRMREWLIERYGNVGAAEWWDEYDQPPLLLDAGCGAALSGLALFSDRLSSVRYLGVDVSTAVDVARDRFLAAGLSGAFLQADLLRLPLPSGTVDVIFSEGVLHHTDSTRDALLALARLLRPGGRFMFYVYRRKGPIREFTDDYIRDRLQGLSPEAAWKALEPLSKLGRTLGDLEVTIDVPEDIDLLDIPAGPIDLQRLIYWHVFKAFYAPEMTLDEMNHINFDWYAPRNAHRQSPAEVRAWCEAAGLEIEREDVQEAGITVIARRPR